MKVFINLLKLNNQSPVYLRSDNEFRTKELDSFLCLQGIIAEFWAPHSSYQNGKAERSNREVEDRIRKLLQGSGVPKNLWPYAFSHSIFLKKRMINKNLSTSGKIGFFFFFQLLLCIFLFHSSSFLCFHFGINYVPQLILV